MIYTLIIIIFIIASFSVGVIYGICRADKEWSSMSTPYFKKCRKIHKGKK